MTRWFDQYVWSTQAVSSWNIYVHGQLNCVCVLIFEIRITIHVYSRGGFSRAWSQYRDHMCSTCMFMLHLKYCACLLEQIVTGSHTYSTAIKTAEGGFLWLNTYQLLLTSMYTLSGLHSRTCYILSECHISQPAFNLSQHHPQQCVILWCLPATKLFEL